ncbi:MAG: hypothetical protein ABIT01_01830 [Thermoanaerobaculia bacterium]
MAHARPEYGIILAGIGVFVAIGVPSLGRGQLFVGLVCLVLAGAVGAWAALVFFRSRR